MEKQTAKVFLRAVLREEDVATVMNFDRNLPAPIEFSSDASVLEKAIDTIELGKGTSLHEAVSSVCRERLMAQGGRKAIILISDGEDTTSQVRFREAIEFVQRADAIVYAISNRLDTPAGTYVIKNLLTPSNPLLIHGTQNRQSALFTPIIVDKGMGATAEIQPKLVFRKYGDQYFLAEIWGNETRGFELPKSAKERQVALNHPEPQLIYIAAK